MALKEEVWRCTARSAQARLDVAQRRSGTAGLSGAAQSTAVENAGNDTAASSCARAS